MRPALSGEEKSCSASFVLVFRECTRRPSTPEFIIACIRSCDSNNEAGGKWQLAVKAEEGARGHAEDNVRLCKNMLGYQHSDTLE